ncbi:MAG TPA: PEGA domain-containing protein, partial [Trueperaceae bacterium]|nr:PEGA domain-containing protein [Trueperaceae bacterium]
VRAGTASFTSSPSGADVDVNGNYVGTTPTGSIRFEAGNYQARFELAGYQATVVNFDVASGRDRSVDVTMRGMQSTVVVQANVGGALVFIDGSQVGSIPNGTGRLQVSNVPSGSHELVVVAPGFATYVTTFNAQGGSTVELNVRQSRFR